MIDIDKWQEIFNSIRKHKLRTSLTAIAVAWGIFMLVILLGSGNGLRNSVERNFGVAKNSIFVWSANATTIAYKGLPKGRYIQFTNGDKDAIEQNVPEVGVLSPRNMLGGSYEIVRGNKSASYRVYGDYPGYIKVLPMIITEGRFLNDIDMEQRRKVAIVGPATVEALFEPGEKVIGKYIRIMGVNFKVVGIFKSKQRGEGEVYRNQEIYIPNTTMQYAFNMTNRIGWFAFIPKEGQSAAVVEQKVKETLAKRHNVSPEDKVVFGSANVEEEYKKVSNLFLGIRLFSWFVSIMTIIAGVVGVGNIMLIIVKERTREIGIRKSLGAKPWSIINMIILEALVITGVAGYLGLLGGVAILEGLNYIMETNNIEVQFFYKPEIDFNTALLAIGVLIFAGVLAGWIPGKRAAKVNPVVALKDE